MQQLSQYHRSNHIGSAKHAAAEPKEEYGEVQGRQDVPCAGVVVVVLFAFLILVAFRIGRRTHGYAGGPIRSGLCGCSHHRRHHGRQFINPIGISVFSFFCNRAIQSNPIQSKPPKTLYRVFLSNRYRRALNTVKSSIGVDVRLRDDKKKSKCELFAWYSCTPETRLR